MSERHIGDKETTRADEAQVRGEVANTKGKGGEQRGSRQLCSGPQKGRTDGFVGSGSQGVHGKAKLWGLRRGCVIDQQGEFTHELVGMPRQIHYLLSLYLKNR